MGVPELTDLQEKKSNFSFKLYYVGNKRTTKETG